MAKLGEEHTSSENGTIYSLLILFIFYFYFEKNKIS